MILALTQNTVGKDHWNVFGGHAVEAQPKVLVGCKPLKTELAGTHQRSAVWCCDYLFNDNDEFLSLFVFAERFFPLKFVVCCEKLVTLPSETLPDMSGDE